MDPGILWQPFKALIITMFVITSRKAYPFVLHCGPNAADYHWTKQVMDKVRELCRSFSLHYYTFPKIIGA
jgi:hypothetical protein